MTRESSIDKKDSAAMDYEARVKRVAHRIRVVGFTILGGIAILLMAFLVYNVLGDMREGRIMDPYTHEPLSPTETSTNSAPGE